MNSMDVSRQRSNILVALNNGFECPERSWTIPKN
jgi:hypothetical protein